MNIPLGPGIGQCCGGYVQVKLSLHNNSKDALKNENFVNDFKSNLYYFLIIGFLGSFTTMSAFSQQTIEMLYNGKDFNALIYVVISIASCLMGTYLAYFLFKTS